MSSESSASSLRRFGLYRTIDERTEEFLRLSRKRQLRQGCICAAISTAITVVVVIIVILIYEYSNVSNAYTTKSDWLGLMNKSDPLQFDPTYKAKFKLDRTSIELLPVLLKAFSMNKYDPNGDDSSTSKSNYREDTTEKMHKNIFADTRNWMKMPTSRVYAIEFKTSPIVYFKNPTRNLDYFRKVRKIRDYERVMNYVDKMINDKVTSGSTQPMLRTDYNSYEKSFLNTATTPMTNWKEKKSYLKTNNDYKKEIEIKHPHICNCSTKVSLLIQKLIVSLQKVIPELAHNKESIIKNCVTHVNDITTTTGEIIQDINKLNKTQIIHNLSEYNISNKIIKTDIKINDKPKEYIHNDNDIDLSNILKLLKPNLNYYIRKANDGNKVQIKTPRKQATNISDSKNQTESKNVNANEEDYSISYNDNIVHQHNNNSNNDTTEFNISTTSSTVTDDYYEDYKENDSNDLSKMINLLDTHTLELVKNNIISTKPYNDVRNTIPTVYKRVTTEMYISKVLSVTEPTQSDFKEYNNIKDDEYAIEANFVDDNLQTSNNNTLLVLNLNKTDTINNKAFYSIEEPLPNYDNKFKSTFKPESKRNILNDATHIDEILERENDKLEEEMEKSTNEDEHVKDMDNTINSVRGDEVLTNKYKTDTTNSSELYYWEYIKIQEHAKNLTKTTLAQNRPTYLEMQRNNWKHEENNNAVEYDANFNNYIFE